ncbi:hypothetical protein [Yoonia sp. BS5-3]|uniref:Uncharacterized protein n=1 Tax=Yoonia phaeophyticola TaxID=3137369 RepID=A0ABZ2UZH6_9RHOB
MVIKVNGMIRMIGMSLLAASTPSIVSANDIALTIHQNGTTIVGEFAGFVDNFYIVTTQNGTAYVPAAVVSCEGTGCVEMSVPTAAAGDGNL